MYRRKVHLGSPRRTCENVPYVTSNLFDKCAQTAKAAQLLEVKRGENVRPSDVRNQSGTQRAANQSSSSPQQVAREYSKSRPSKMFAFDENQLLLNVLIIRRMSPSRFYYFRQTVIIELAEYYRTCFDSRLNHTIENLFSFVYSLRTAGLGPSQIQGLLAIL